MSLKNRKFIINVLLSLCLICMFIVAITPSLTKVNNANATVVEYDYATTYEAAEDRYFDDWLIVPDSGYVISNKHWTSGFEKNTKLHIKFSINDTAERSFKFYSGGGGYSNSYNLNLKYATDEISFTSHANKKTTDAVDYTLNLNTVYDLEFSIIEIFEKGADMATENPVGERVTAKITDGTNAKTITYDFLGSERCGYAASHDEGIISSFGFFESNNTAAVTIYPCNPIKENINGRYVYATSFDKAPQLDLQQVFNLNADGMSLNEGGHTKEWHEYYPNKYTKNTILNMQLKLNESNPSTQTSYRLYFGGGTMWNSYALYLNYASDYVYLLSSYTPEGASKTVTATSPQESFTLDYNKAYDVSICLIDIYDAANVDPKKPVGDRVMVKISDGTKTVTITSDFFGAARCGYAQGHYETPGEQTTLNRFGFYSGSKDTEVYLLPYRYQRDYVLTINTPERKVLVELSYGDEYNFTTYAPQKPMYELKGYSAAIDGGFVEVPITGSWTYDIINTTAGKYSATLTPIYSPIEYQINYNVNNASLPQGVVTKITADEELDLPTLTNVTDGYVFMGWYSDDAFNNIVDKITCNGAAVNLYAKVVEGYTFTIELPTGNQVIPVEKNANFDLSQIVIDGYTVSGWQQFNGTNYVDVGTTVLADANKTFKPISAKTQYSITYQLNGGTNHADNVSSYTIDDSFTFKTPTKNGHLFVRFVDELGNTVTGIEQGTTGNLTLTAEFLKDNFESTVQYFVSNTAQALPIFAIPETATSTVSVSFGNEPVAVENGFALLNNLGDYTVSYTINLLGGEVVNKTVVIKVSKLTITLDGSYAANYTSNSWLNLIDATCEKQNADIVITVYKDGEEIEYHDFRLLLETGEYTVQYSILNEVADDLTVTFKVGGASGCAGSLTASSYLPIIFAILAVSAIIIIKNIKKRREK